MKYRTASISLDPATHESVAQRLVRLGMTRSEYVRNLIRKDLAKADPKPTTKKGNKQ